MPVLKNSNQIFVKVEEFSFLKSYYKVFIIIKSLEPFLKNYFFIDLNNHVNFKKSCFYIVDSSSQNYYSCPKLLIDNDNPDKLTITVLINDNFIKKKYELLSFKIFEYPMTMEFIPPFNFNCNLCISEDEKENCYLVNYFYKSTENCQGIDLVLNKKVFLLPLEEKIIEISKLFKFGFSKLIYEEHLFFLRSRFLRSGVKIITVYYSGENILVKILNTSLKNIDLGERFLQVCCPISNSKKFCLQHFRFNNYLIRNSKLSFGDCLIMAKRYETATEESLIENFHYIFEKTLRPSEEYLLKKNLDISHAECCTTDKCAIKNTVLFEDLKFIKHISSGDGSYELEFSHTSNYRKKARKQLALSMEKLVQQLIAVLMIIIPEKEVNILRHFDNDGESGRNYFNIGFIDGHVAEGKTEEVHAHIAHEKVYEFDDLLRAQNNLILKNHQRLIPIMYFCQLFVALNKPGRTMCVDRSPLSHYLFAFMDQDEEENVFKDLSLTDLFVFISLMSASSMGQKITFIIKILKDPPMLTKWFSRRDYEEEFYKDKDFNKIRSAFRSRLIKICKDEFKDFDYSQKILDI